MKFRTTLLITALVCWMICALMVWSAHASWMFAVCTMEGGSPKIDTSVTPYHGHVLSGQLGQYGAYLFSGTNAQLIALNALPNVIGIVAVTNNGDVHWTELDNTIAAGVRTKLNTWLTNNGKPTIPAGWTNRQVILALFRHLRPSFDWNQDWVKDE